MMKRSVLAGLAAIAAGFALSAQAADPAAGQKIFEQTCVACHGPKGISTAPIWPNLAGQKEEYITTSLKAYRDGGRTEATMSPQAAGLSDTDIANLAAYISRLKPTAEPAAAPADADDGASGNASAGGKLYNATCIACHGPRGISVAPVYPNLGGQKHQYLVNEITAYRDGDRKDPIMAPMARHLSDEDIANLASYLSQVGR